MISFQKNVFKSVHDSISPIMLISKLAATFNLTIHSSEIGRSKLLTAIQIIVIMVSLAHLGFIPYAVIYIEEKPEISSGINETLSHVGSLGSQKFITKMSNIILISMMSIAVRVCNLIKMSKYFPALLDDINNFDKIFPTMDNRDFKKNVVLSALLVVFSWPYQIYSILVVTTDSWMAFLMFYLNLYNNFTIISCEFQFVSLCWILESRFIKINETLSELYSTKCLDNGKNIPKPLSRYASGSNARWEGNYNDFHQPEGNFQKKHAELQKKHNMTLIFGIVFFIGSFLFGTVTGLWENYAFFPDRPADSNCYKPDENGDKNGNAALVKLTRVKKSCKFLSDAFTKLNNLYGFQMLIILGGLFLNVLFGLYFSIFGGFTKNSTTTSAAFQRISNVINEVLWSIYYLARFIFVCVVAEAVTYKANIPRKMICNNLDEAKYQPLQRELWIFLAHIMTHKIFFTASGFFKINKSLITSAISMGTTYLVILAQFQKK